MPRYILRFSGKRAGAIGLSDYHTIVVEAADEEEARLKAYDTHDHIMGMTFELLKEEGEHLPTAG